jgi:hypothetical protein
MVIYGTYFVSFRQGVAAANKLIEAYSRMANTSRQCIFVQL